VALAGVLDQHPFEDPAGRAWGFRTVGRGHRAEFWAAFVAALRDVGYDDMLSIENEDEWQPAEEGVREAAAFMRPILGDAQS
jgi:sugar phosphate isomerase/epimerase